MDYGLASATADGQNPAPREYEKNLNLGIMTVRGNISFIPSGAGFCPSAALNAQGQGSLFWKTILF